MMGDLVSGCLMPHPPIIIEEIGGRETAKAKETVAAMRELAREIVAQKPEVVVFITPHGASFADAMAITKAKRHTGNLKEFGAPGIQFDYPNAEDLVESIKNKNEGLGIRVALLDASMARKYRLTTKMDHGVMVPLHFLREAGLSCNLAIIGMGFLPIEEVYFFGAALRQAILASSSRVVVVASGDLSHRLHPGAPAGYDPRGKEFDENLRKYLSAGDRMAILDMDPELREAAGECGYRPLVALLGSMDGCELKGRVLSHEGPFGVGYMVAEVLSGGGNVQPLVEVILGQRHQRVAEQRAAESKPVQLARQSLEHYVNQKSFLEVPSDIRSLSELQQPAGSFVSLKKHGHLRGCIGTVFPTTKTLAEEIIRNAVSAGTADPRFDPVLPGELEEIVYSVDVLNPPEPVTNISELDPKKFGVIVRRGSRLGLLLPDLDGVDTIKEQVRIAKEKAGISPYEECQMEKFTVTRYS